MATLTKRNIIVEVTNKLSHKEATQAFVTEVLDCFIASITEQLCSGDKVVIRNFGVFQVNEIKPKVGRNPRKPEQAINIPASAVVKFKPGQELKEKVAKTLPIIREKNR